MILELVLIHVQPISAFYLWFSAVVQTISWFYPWVLIKFKPMPRILPLFSKQLHNLFQHVHWFAIVAPHISAAYRECSSIFSTSRIGVHQFFFFRSLSHQLSSLCLCFFHFLCSSIFILFITCFLFGIVFTWSLLWYIASSILIICSCFILRFHHISYIYIRIYIVAPSQVFCFKEIRKLPQEDHQTCDAKSLYQLWHCKCNFAKKYLNYSCQKLYVCYAYCVFYFVSPPCHGTTLHPATNGG